LEEDRPVKTSASPDVLPIPQSDGAPKGKKQKEPRTKFLANAEHRGALLDFFARKGAGSDAEDLVQEVLIRGSESQNFPADEIQQVMYAFGIARDRIKDWYETSRRWQQLENLVARNADVSRRRSGERLPQKRFSMRRSGLPAGRSPVPSSGPMTMRLAR
jgi:hypothetical protein